MDTSLEARIECLVTGKLGSLSWQGDCVIMSSQLWFINTISCHPPVLQFCSAYITRVNAQLLPSAELLMWWHGGGLLTLNTSAGMYGSPW